MIYALKSSCMCYLTYDIDYSRFQVKDENFILVELNDISILQDSWIFEFNAFEGCFYSENMSFTEIIFN